VIRLSVREVMQLSERCFRAAGWPRGAASDAAGAIWWAEAYRGEGIETLHGLLDELSAFDVSALSLRDPDAVFPVVDGGDQPALVAAGPTLDLCCGRAERRGIGVAYAGVGDGTASTVGHLAYRAADRGFDAAVFHTDATGATAVVGTPASSCPHLAAVDHPDPAAGHARLADRVAAGVDGRVDAPLARAFFGGEEHDERYGAADARLWRRLLEGALEPATDADLDPGLALVCVDPDHPSHSDDLRRVTGQFLRGRSGALTRTFEPSTVGERVETLFEEGVPVERATWRDVFEFSTGVLAPPFEGSEMGAGFDLNRLG